MSTFDQDELVTVASYSEPAAAQLALSVLEDAGIEAFLSGEEANSLMPQALGARLMVKPEDEQAAAELLNNDLDGDAPLADDGNDL